MGVGPNHNKQGFQKEGLLYARCSCKRVSFFSSANLAEGKEGRSFAVRRRRICIGGSSLVLLLRLLAPMELRGEVQGYSRELNFLWTRNGREGCDVDAKVSATFSGAVYLTSPQTQQALALKTSSWGNLTSTLRIGPPGLLGTLPWGSQVQVNSTNINLL